MKRLPYRLYRIGFTVCRLRPKNEFQKSESVYIPDSIYDMVLYDMITSYTVAPLEENREFNFRLFRRSSVKIAFDALYGLHKAC